MPNGTKSYKVGSDVYDIPNEKSASFLKAYPNAQEVQSYAVDKDTFDIPVPKVNDFLKAYPQAKPIGYDSKEVQQNQQKTYTYHPELGHPIENNQQALENTLQDYSATHQQSKNASLGYDNAFVPKGKSGSDIITANEKAADEKLTKAAENTYNKTIGRGSHTQADSANYVNQLKQGVKNGDLGVTQDAAGNDVIKNSGNFFQSFKAASDQAYAQDIENKYLRSIPKDEAISYLNRIKEKPETGIVKESDIAPNGLGELAGSQSQLIGKTTMGGMAGAETGLTGGASAGGFLAIAKDLANSGYSQALKKNYYLLKQQGLSDSEAFDKATQAGLVGEATNLGTGVLLSGEINLMPKKATVQSVENLIKHTIKTAPKVVGSAGVGSVINDITTNAEANGNPIDAKQMLLNSEEAMKPMLLIHGAVNALGLIANGQKTIVPSYTRPQLENMAASADRNAVSTYLNQQEQKGEIPQGTTQKVLSTLSAFDKQKAVVAPFRISEENKAAIVGKLVQKDKLLNELSSLKPNENAFPERIAEIKKDITGIDGEISKLYNAKNVFEKETDSNTGEKNYQSKTFEELKPQEINGIVVPKEYGATDVTEKGEGDTKTFTPKAFYIEKQGALEIKKNIPIDEKSFTDKDKAQAAADNALKQHYYENGLHDNAKPDKKITEEKNQTLPASENNEAGNSSNGFKPTSEESTTEKGIGEVVQPQQENKVNTTDYRGQHQLTEIKTNASDLQGGGTGFDWEHVAQDHDLSDKSTKESYRVLKTIKDNPDADVTIYRSVPKDIDKINEGDWITLSKNYATEHGMDAKDEGKDAPVISMKVKAKDISWDGNDLNEFVYKPRKYETERNNINKESTSDIGSDSEVKQITSKPIQPNSVVEGLKDVKSTTKALEDLSKNDKKAFNYLIGFADPKVEKVGVKIPIKDINETNLYGQKLSDAVENVKKGFDSKEIISPTVYEEDGKYIVVDGFHRIAKAKSKGENNIKVDIVTPDSEKLSEYYHKAKTDGSNPELVKAVEDAIGNKPENPKTNSVVEDKLTNENIPPEPPKEEPPLGEGADDETTSIKNATTRLRREQHGLDDEIPAAKKEFGDTWNEAKDKIENGYNPQDLIDELAKKPRPVTDVENAILLHAQNTKEINLIDLNNKINEAAEKNDTQALQEAKVAKARVLDELQKLYDVNKAVGTENARGLASRQMMVDRRYSLSNMIAEKRATANDGKPLSEEQQAQVEELHKKINETQKAFDDYVKQAESEIKVLQEKILGKKITNKKSAAQKLRDFADKIEKNASGQTYATVIPITPKMIAGAMRLIADGLEKGEDVLNLIKDAIEKIKGENSDIDEAKLRKAINSEVINSNIISTTEKAAKKNKDYSGLLLNNKLDRKALELNAASERAKNEFDISLKKDEASKKSFFQKTQNVFVKWQRGFKLSNPLTMGKLVMAGLTRLTTTPLEDIVGAGYSQVLPQLAKGAIGEGGGLHINETVKAYKDGLLEGMKDAATIMKKGSQGKSDIDVSFGKLGELPPEAIDFFGQLHSATKAPIKRIAFERSLSKRLRRNIANGVDVSDPLVQTEILTGAYKDANRAIFMQDNKVATGFQNLVKYFEQEDKQTGKAVNKPLATALQWMLPFVKIPTNIAAETGAHVYGVPLEIGKGIVRMFDKNESKLTADEKDIIFRNLKKGTLGVAALALGYFNPQNFGGYYQKGQKRQDDDAQALGLKIFGHRIPAWFVEAPIFQAMQLGATIRRVKDDKVKGVEKGIGEGVWAGALGLVDRVPMVDQPMRMAGLFSSQKDREYYVDELAKSTVDPALITYFANVTDPADNKSIAGKILNPENKRSPQTMLEHIKSGLPYFREQVGEKPQSFNEKDKKDPTFKYFLDKGLQLPNTSLSSETVPNTDNKVSDYPKDIQDKYIKAHKDALKNQLSSIKENKIVYVTKNKTLKGNIVTHVAIDEPDTDNYKEVNIDKLTKDELAQVLSIAQKNATTEAKKEVFGDDNQ